MTAEPRMEDLLASIRKAINEDIGPEAGSAPLLARPATTRMPHETSAASSEIQQLREKISRSRIAETAALHDTAQRAASLAAALRSNTPRRAWRDIEPVVQAQVPPPPPPPLQPAPRLRSTITEPEPPRPQPRVERSARPASGHTTAERQPAARPPAEKSDPQPRDSGRNGQPPMLSSAPAQAVQTAFSRLAETVVSRAVNEQSLEDMTREALNGMLKQWLDEHLPDIVERLVREEIERVSRTGR